jgi:hypothetical protein
MPVALVVVAAVEIAATVAQTVMQKQAANAAARTATAVADYNNKVDLSQAAQIDFDAQANIAAMRRDAATYMSRQANAYAGNGIIANKGSALAVQAMTAGRFAMKEQQAWNDAQAKESYLASEGQAGIAEGQSQAEQDNLTGVADVMGGAGKVAGELGSAYAGGAFGKGGSNTSTALSTPQAGPGGSENITDPGE